MIALGAVVDDAIIDLENIIRRLRQYRRAGSEKSTAAIILEASLEVRSPDRLRDVDHRRGRGADLPAARSDRVVLPPARRVVHAGDRRVDGRRADRHPGACADPAAQGTGGTSRITAGQARCNAGIRAVLSRIVQRPKSAYAGCLVLVLAGVLVVLNLGQSLFPTFKERDFLMHFLTAPGTSVAEEARMITTSSARICGPSPGCETFGSHIGQAFLGEEVAGVNFGENWISIDENADYDETIAAIQKRGRQLPRGVSRRADLPQRADRGGPHRGQGAHRRAGLRGGPADHSADKAHEIERKLAGIARHHRRPRRPAGRRAADRGRGQPRQGGASTGSNPATCAGRRPPWSPARRSATSSGTARPTTRWCGAPRRPGTTWQASATCPSTRRPARSSTSATSPRWRSGRSPTSIERENDSRRIDVAANVKGRDLGSVVADVKTVLTAVTFERGYHAELLGEYAEREAAQSHLGRIAHHRRAGDPAAAAGGLRQLAARDAGLPHPARGARRRRAGRLYRRRQCLAGFRSSASSRYSG